MATSNARKLTRRTHKTADKKGHAPARRALAKTPSGIDGFDQITGGGLPRGRTTLVCGGAGCGKTLFAMEFLVNGALHHDEPGVFMAFEESDDELASNVASLGFDLNELQRQKKLVIDFVKIDASEIEESGDYDLAGLFVRLAHAIDAVNAKRVVLDTVEALFSGFTNEGVLRSELRRLFRWLKEKDVTAVITGEQGDGILTRYGLEEYVSDCVIGLDNRIEDQVATRRLRVIKYRGSSHGSNEYPFLIDEHGFSVLPVTSLGLDYAVSSERVSTGVPRLDDMLDGGGYFRGSSVLISGTAGTGKSSVAAQFVDESCRRGERAIYFALEESSAQVVRNMRSIGVNLETWVKKGLLSIQAARPTVFGLEMHLVTMHKAVEQFAPRAVVLDPISSLMSSGNIHEVKSMMVRLFDYLKMKEITCLVTSLAHGNSTEETAIGISSLIDTWFQLRDIEIAGERTRGLYLVKSRGMGHSNQVREFLITNAGIDLVPVAIGPSGVLTGSARLNQEALQRAEALQQEQEIERRERDLLRRKRALDAQIETLRLDYLAAEEDTTAAATQAREQTQRVLDQRAQQTESRSGKVTRSKR
ncbi:MAG TPA: circadian clock protein KaiC [Polyangia bacterium]|nr:circadian clock protein KaiC [Polyangia bacterium]